METIRHLLFKMPAIDRPQYASKLLEILALPSNMIVQMGTYTFRWVPEEIRQNPELCLGPAWVVCVSKGDNDEPKFIPIREVNVVKSIRDQETLRLWFETRDYLSCDDYGRFQDEIREHLSTFPPSQNSFISLNFETSQIANVHPVNSNDDSAINEVWMKIVKELEGNNAFSDTIFYRVVKISVRESSLDTEDASNADDPHRIYRLRVNEITNLQFYYSVPDKQFEKCPQHLEISANDWIKIYGEGKIDDRLGDLRVSIRPLSTSEEYPYNNTMSMKIAIRSNLIKSPSIEIKFRLLKEKLRVRARRNAPHLILALVLGAVFFVAQMLPSVLTNKAIDNASLIGATVSSTVVAITTLVPLLISVVLEKLSQQP